MAGEGEDLLSRTGNVTTTVSVTCPGCDVTGTEGGVRGREE